MSRRANLCVVAVVMGWVVAVSAGAEGEREAVVGADRELGRLLAAGDVEGFKGLLAEDVAFLGATVARGPAAAVESWAPLFSEDGPRLTWEPSEVVVAQSGEVAYSSGEWRSVPPGGGEAASGQYLTLWRRHPRHGWQVVVDGSRADDLEALVARAARELRLDPAEVVEPRLDRGSAPRHSSAAGDLTWTLAPVTLRFSTAEGPVEATATLLTLWRPDDPVDPAAQAVSGFQRPEE